MQSRNLSIDLGKGIFIALVVLGHFLEATNYWKSGPFRLTLTFIYLLHIPAFAFLSGITAKVGKGFSKTVINLTLLLTFQGLFFVFIEITNSDRDFSYFPFWLLWFLVALNVWQLSVGAIKKYPKTFVVGSLVLASLSGTMTWVGNDFALSRTLSFFPFFVIGSLYGSRILSFAEHVKSKIVLVTFAFLSLFLGLLTYALHLKPWWFFANRSFEDLGVGNEIGVVTRLAILAVSSIFVFSSLAFLKYLPKFVSVLGQRSLAIYLFHGFAVMTLDQWLKSGYEITGSYFSVVFAVLLSALVLWLFAQKGFTNLLIGLGTVPENIWARKRKKHQS